MKIQSFQQVFYRNRIVENKRHNYDNATTRSRGIDNPYVILLRNSST